MKGRLIIFSAPSGAGKTTIARMLLDSGLPLEFSVSACSRPPRTNETEGKDYYFVSVEEFRMMIERERFVEWEEVYHNHYYGTLKSELDRIWDAGKHVVFDVDVAGGLNLKKKYGSHALSVFIMPPSLEELKKRLTLRASDTSDKIKTRLEKAASEMTYANRFDRIIINDELEKAFKETYNTVKDFISS